VPHHRCQRIEKGHVSCQIGSTWNPRVIRLGDLIDPTPGGRASPKEERGVVTKKTKTITITQPYRPYKR
jgi:hypothetical protein